MSVLTPAQCRAARAMLDASREEVAEASKVSFATIRRHEQGLHPPVQPHTLRRIKSALEVMGAEFIEPNGVSLPAKSRAA
jgi:hypothetical protein